MDTIVAILKDILANTKFQWKSRLFMHMSLFTQYPDTQTHKSTHLNDLIITY